MSIDVLPAPSRNGCVAHAPEPCGPTAMVLPEPVALSELDEPTVQRIKQLPKDVGVMLVTVGVAGFVLPGIVGVHALIAGGLVLWPGAFNRLDEWFARRTPSWHHLGMQQIGRFLDDLERRYPPKVDQPH